MGRPMELHEIINRVRDGDSQQFSRLVSRYRDMAFGYALTLLDQEQMAEDAVQEAFVVAYTQLNRLQQPQAFGAWLRGIVRHQCYRERRNSPRFLSWEQMEEIATEEPDPAHDVTSSALKEQVQAALAELPSETQKIIQLYYEAGFSQKEIAASLNLTLGAVNMRLHAARTRLRRRLLIMNERTSINDQTLTVGQTVHPAQKGRVQKADGVVVTLQFAPDAVPPLFSLLLADGRESFCVVQHLSAGRVQAVALHAEALWRPGQEVLASGQPFTGALALSSVQQAVTALSSQHSDLGQRASGHLESGIKTIEVFAPLTQGGCTGLFSEWGLGVLVLLPELMHNLDGEENRQTFLVFLPPLRDAQHWQEVTGEITAGSTNIAICFLPVADPISGAFVDAFPSLTATLVLSRRLAEQAIWPSLDPLYCRSPRREKVEAGSEQALLAAEVRQLLGDYYALQFPAGAEGRRTLSRAEQQRIQRARKALRLLSQPFFVAEPYTGKPGVFVTSEEAARSFRNLLAGSYDGVSTEAFYMIGVGP